MANISTSYDDFQPNLALAQWVLKDEKYYKFGNMTSDNL